MHDGDPAEGAEVFDFVAEFLRDREHGLERPLSEYLARHPGREEAIAREWLSLHGDEVAEVAPAPDRDDGQRVGPWLLVRELGRGGQGAVWLAEDTRIARRAALKLLPDSFALLDADRRRRLKREAEALARLDHPGICPVLEAEIEAATPYLAMRLIEGEPLSTVVAHARADTEKERGGSAHDAAAPGRSAGAAALTLPPSGRADLERVLRFFEHAARALHVAHETGVVHRDVKPGNVMVTPDGRPVLLDFGQARDDSATLEARTLTGEVVGTPAYMSPEQVRGRGREVDRRTDVWSLGATLYETLTLQRPFDGASIAELLLAIDAGPLPSLSGHGLPRDLEIVLETALERDLSRRYATALDLAEDLRRVREHEPVRARPAGPLLRLSRWTRRHPAIAVSLAAVLLALSGGLAWTLHLLAREQRALDWALGGHLAKRTLALIEEDPAAALALGIEAVEKADNYETRAALLAALDACHLESLIEAAPARRILDLDLDPDQRTAAAALDDGRVLLFDLEAGAPAGELRAGDGAILAVRFLNAGAELVAGGDDGRLRWWDLRARRVAREVELAGDALLALALDPAGERLAASTRGGGLELLSARDGAREAHLETPGLEPDTLRFSPDGRRLLAFRRGLPGDTVACTPTALLVGVGTGRVERSLGVPEETLTWAQLDAVGERVVTASLEGRVRIWSAGDGSLLAGPHELGQAIWCAAPSPDGTRVALACEDGQPSRAWLWDTRSGVRIPLAGHDQARVVHVAYSPDGERVASASFDRSVRVFDAASGQPRMVFRGFVQPLASLWSRDCARLLTLGNGNAAPVWIARGRPDVFALVGHAGPVTRARLSADGTRALTVSVDGTARLWSTAAPDHPREVSPPCGECLAVLTLPGEVVLGACFTLSGAVVVAWGADGELRSWSSADGIPRERALRLPAPVRELVAAPVGGRAAALLEDGRVHLIDTQTLESAGRLEGVEEATCAVFSHDGALLAVGQRSGGALVVTAAGPPVAVAAVASEPGGASAVVDLAFGPGAEVLALACEDRRVRFVRLSKGGGEARSPLVVFPPLALDWSRDGNRLLVIGSQGGGALRLHDLAGDAQVRLQLFHGGNLTCGELSPDGELALSGSLDGTVYVRSALDGTPVAQLVGHAAAVLDATFSHDPGALRVITASADGTARVWPVDPLPPARARRPRPLSAWERAREQRLAEPLRYR